MSIPELLIKAYLFGSLAAVTLAALAALLACWREGQPWYMYPIGVIAYAGITLLMVFALAAIAAFCLAVAQYLTSETLH